MKYLLPFCLLLFLSACQSATTEDQNATTALIDYVNPFIGTDGKGKTYPGASVPYGMVQLSPDNGRNGWDWISGYFYPDSVIAGFSHLHLTGTGAGDLYDISFLPTSGPLRLAKLDEINSKETVHSAFSHNKEQASPGYYQVYLDDYQVNVELSATERTGIQRYRYDQKDNQVRLHLGYTRNWDGVTNSQITILNDSTVAGYRFSNGWARDQRVYFVSVFSKPWEKGELSNAGEEVTSDTISGKDILAVFDFGESQEVLVKTGISTVSMDNAMLNLSTEQTNFDFEAIRLAAEKQWEAQLQKVVIEASEDNKMQFYTAFYHSMLAPTLLSDVDGRYRGTNNEIFTADGYQRHCTFSLWDTYRALHPWMTIVQSEKMPDVTNSLLSFYAEAGQLPVWSMAGKETNMMIGYHSVPVLADAILKGYAVDTLEAYRAMKASAMQDDFGIREYKDLGYVPHEYGSWNVSLTLEYAYDDWCIAQVAQLLGETEDYNYFMERARSYRNHFDAETRFFRAKDKNGAFKEEWDPLAYEPSDYCEANAWQYYWYVPQDVPDLIELTGGKTQFVSKLDQMFTTEQEEGESPEWISGYIGQYVHGNEPSHHVPYLYQFAGQPVKTQARLREVMDELYTTAPDGLAGNEDCGQMSAWYLFSALGFYPVNPANGIYVLGSPEVGRAKIQLPEGKTLTIIAENQASDHVYVKSVKLNDQELETFYLTHDQIMEGGTLVFEMSAE
ncbi:MAG: GH92 family glycosyl hydrolase [Bacteroidota bacterium]